MRKFLGLFGAAAIVAVSLFIPTAKAEAPAPYATKLADGVACEKSGYPMQNSVTKAPGLPDTGW